jgi:hypothetical protein
MLRQQSGALKKRRGNLNRLFLHQMTGMSGATQMEILPNIAPAEATALMQTARSCATLCASIYTILPARPAVRAGQLCTNGAAHSPFRPPCGRLRLGIDKVSRLTT